jgi:regulator of sigma E protease
MELVLSILTSAFWVILAISILVVVHELGHFLTAKYFGMRVDRFSVGFPPKLFGRRYGETEYVFGATPLGGYVKIKGMIDESLDTDHVDEAPEPWEFRAKPVWQRIVVITAGVIFNVILAVVVFGGIRWAQGETYIPAQNIDQVYVEEGSVAYDMGLRTGDHIVRVNGADFTRFDQILPPSIVAADSLTVTVDRDSGRVTINGPRDIITRISRAQNSDEQRGFGISFLPPLVGWVQDGSPADSIGLRPGDRILSVASDSVRFWQEMSTRIQRAEGQPVSVRWHRPDSLAADSQATAALLTRTGSGGYVFEAQVAAKQDPESGRYLLGIAEPRASELTTRMLHDEFGIRTEMYGPGAALRAGVADTWTYARNIVVTLQRVIVGRDNLRDSLGGPVMIAKVTSQAAEAGAAAFWRIVAALSITLAIMNILPIPALDGGQLMFLLYEGVTRRRPSVRVRLVAQQIGMILLLGFMAFLIFNDILRL